MKILKIIGFVVLSLCIFSFTVQSAPQTKTVAKMESNVQISDLQTQKKLTILNTLEKENLILTEVKQLEKNKKEDVLCLALNMYHEGRGSSIEDRIATTYVVFNRQSESLKKKSICDVVFERWQFCWTNDNKVSVPKELQIWNQIQKDAYKLYLNPQFKKLADDFKLKHYVATYMIPMKNKPKWIDKRYFRVEIGKHSYISLNKDDLPYKNNMIKVVQQGKNILLNNILVQKKKG